jgi:hypothetical protein
VKPVLKRSSGDTIHAAMLAASSSVPHRIAAWGPPCGKTLEELRPVRATGPNVSAALLGWLALFFVVQGW